MGCNMGKMPREGVTIIVMQDGFVSCKVVSNKEAAEGLRQITVEVSKDIANGYSVPGQYVKMRKDSSQEKPGFFAIASAPGKGDTFEFLIKRTDGSAWICDAASGANIDVSTVQGNGYKYGEKFGADVTDVLLLATGSGIAPLKAVIESQGLKSKNLKLYYGAQSPSKMAFQDRFSAWEKDCGVTVVPCMSKSAEGMRTGYVQKCMIEDGIKAPSSTGVLFCGVNDMVKEAKALLEKEGVKPENMLTNF